MLLSSNSEIDAIPVITTLLLLDGSTIFCAFDEIIAQQYLAQIGVDWNHEGLRNEPGRQ